MKKLGYVDVEYGNIALLKKEDKKQWEKQGTGSIIGASFSGPDDFRLYWHLIKTKKWKNVKEKRDSYYFSHDGGKRDAKKLETLLHLTGEKGRFNGKYQVLLDVYTNCTYDRFLYHQKPVLQIHSSIPSNAYVNLTPDGHYYVYGDENAVEVRFEKVSLRNEEEEIEVYENWVEQLDELTLESPTIFVFEDLGYIETYSTFYGVEFELSKGNYIVEQGYGSDGSVVTTRIRRN